MDNTHNIPEQNVAVTNWFATTFQKIKAAYMAEVHSPDRSGEGLSSLQYKLHKNFNEVDGGGIKFNRYLVFVHKGAGRGFGGGKGSKWIGADGHLKSTNPLSLGKMGSGSRHQEPWLNPVLDTEIPKLADIVADFKADAAIKAIQIK